MDRICWSHSANPADYNHPKGKRVSSRPLDQTQVHEHGRIQSRIRCPHGQQANSVHAGAATRRDLPPSAAETFRELVTDLYVHSISFRGLSCLLALLGCGVGAATLWRDVQAVVSGLAPDPQADLLPWVEVDETWLSIGGEKRPVAVVLGPKDERWPCA